MFSSIMGKMNLFNNIKKKIWLRDGHLIILAHMLDKLINFILMIIAARYMNLAIYGNFSYVKSLVASVTPFSGFGGNHALLRFGMDSEAHKEKYNILVSSLVYGAVFTLLLIFAIKLFLNLGGFMENDAMKKMFDIYIFFILSYYIFDVGRNYYRILGDNSKYAWISIRYSVLTLLVSSLALIFFDAFIFIIVLVILPILLFVFENKNIFRMKSENLQWNPLFWRYGFTIGLGAFLNQFFLQSDIIIQGYLGINPEAIAQYKVATLLVYTFLFIPNAFLVRDFTLISANAKNSIFLKKYVYEYWKYSGLVLLFIIPSFFLFSDKILILLFGDKFQNSLSIQNILICGLASMVLLRMLFGNILNAVGKAKLNVINAVVTIILALPLLFWLTKYYGILGTAYGMLGMFFVSGLISLGMFLYYLRTISAIGGFHETAHHR